MVQKGLEIKRFVWDADIEKWKCKRCGSYNTDERPFNVDLKLRSDCDGTVFCKNCGNSEVY